MANNNTIKASVLMPAYNDARYIRDAIDSILDQTFKDFELIIVNDGSTDETSQILSNYTDPRIRVINHPENRGRACARNTALETARGEYVLWMDADDISMPRRLEKQIAFMEMHPDISVVGGRVQCFHGSDKLLTYDYDHRAIKNTLLFGSPIPNSASCLRLSDIRSMDAVYDTKLTRAQDYDFWCQLLLDHKAKAANLPDLLLLYRVTIFTDKVYHTEVQRRILKRLGIDADEAMLQQCFEMGTILPRESLSFSIDSYRKTSLKIIAANKKKNIFAQQELEIRIFNRLATLIIYSVPGLFLQLSSLIKMLGYKYFFICGAKFFSKSLKKHLHRVFK